MNEAIFAALCADDYTDALTLGPFPGIVDSVDVTVQAAAVLAQIYRNVDTGVQASDPREYLLLPGSRTISNVTGIRFRNKYAGIPGIVTASLGGPDIPQIGPVFADTPLVGAPLFVTQAVKADGGGAAVPFTGVPPSGYGGLLIYASTINAPIWVFVENQLPGSPPLLSRQHVYLPANTSIYWVLALPASTVSVGFENGLPNQGGLTLGVWPTNLPSGTYLAPPQAGGSASPVLYQADGLAIPAGGAALDLPVPFVGEVAVIVGGAAVANLDFSISLLDTLGGRIGFEVQQAMGGPGSAPGSGFLVPGRHQVGWFNGTGVAQNVFLSVIGKYGGVSP